MHGRCDERHAQPPALHDPGHRQAAGPVRADARGPCDRLSTKVCCRPIGGPPSCSYLRQATPVRSRNHSLSPHPPQRAGTREGRESARSTKQMRRDALQMHTNRRSPRLLPQASDATMPRAPTPLRLPTPQLCQQLSYIITPAQTRNNCAQTPRSVRFSSRLLLAVNVSTPLRVMSWPLLSAGTARAHGCSDPSD